jgi:hypothetical protein
MAAQRLERSDNPGNRNIRNGPTLKGLAAHMPNPFRVGGELEYAIPRVLAALEPWAEISERLRRY